MKQFSSKPFLSSIIDWIFELKDSNGSLIFIWQNEEAFVWSDLNHLWFINFSQSKEFYFVSWICRWNSQKRKKSLSALTNGSLVTYRISLSIHDIEKAQKRSNEWNDDNNLQTLLILYYYPAASLFTNLLQRLNLHFGHEIKHNSFDFKSTEQLYYNTSLQVFDEEKLWQELFLLV